MVACLHVCGSESISEVIPLNLDFEFLSVRGIKSFINKFICLNVSLAISKFIFLDRLKKNS